jgi:hypothetical protein
MWAFYLLRLRGKLLEWRGMQCIWSKWLELFTRRSHHGAAIGTHSSTEPATKRHIGKTGFTTSKLVFENQI